MISFDVSLQNKKKDELPKVVADWIEVRNRKYPDVDFRVDQYVYHPSNKSEFQAVAKKYGMLFSTAGRTKGIVQVFFCFLEERWSVRLIGFLSPEQRDIVSGFANETGLEKISDGAWGRLRTKSEPLIDRPTDFVPVHPDGRATAAFSTTGQAVMDAEKSFKVSKYNDPNRAEDIGLLPALENEKDPFEASVLAYKIIVSGALADQKILPDEKGTEVKLGVLVPFGEQHIRVDVLAERGKDVLLAVRCFAKEECMSLDERIFWASVIPESFIKSIIFAYFDTLHPLDEAMIRVAMQKHPKVKLMKIGGEEK